MLSSARRPFAGAFRPALSGCALATGASLLVASAAAAQEAVAAPASQPFFGHPVVVLQPGLLVTPVISGIGPGDAGLYGGSDTKAYFNARFVAVVPTRLPWFQLVAGAQFQPNFKTSTGVKSNQPALFYGGIIPFPAVTTATNGWLGLSLDPFALYYLGGGGGGAPYGHDLTLEGALTINVGQKMMQRTPFFGSTSVYVLLDQIVTHPPRNADGSRDRFWPILLTGLTIPVGR